MKICFYKCCHTQPALRLRASYAPSAQSSIETQDYDTTPTHRSAEALRRPRGPVFAPPGHPPAKGKRGLARGSPRGL